jgi:mono/diheme cytochrome c family protein
VGRRDLLIAGGSIVVAISVVLGVQLVANDGDAAGLVELDAAAVLLGTTVYSASCAGCHGVSAEGQPNWRERRSDGTLPAPPHDASGHTWHHADGLLYRIIRDGGAQFAGPTTPSAMPAFGEQLSDSEIRAVLAYLKSLWGGEERSFQSEVSVGDPFP